MARKNKKRMIPGPVPAPDPQRRRIAWYWWAGGLVVVALVVVAVATLTRSKAVAPPKIASVVTPAKVASGVASANIASADQVQRITATEAKALLDRGEALIYDTRSAESYQAKHIPQAHSLPEGDVTKLANTLPKDKALIFYCT